MGKRAWTVVAVLLVAAACSGGGTDEVDDDRKEAFLPRAEAVCEETAARIAERQAAVDQADPASREAYISFVAGQVLDAVDALRALGLPDGDADELDAALDVYQDRFGTYQDDPSSVSLSAADEELRDAAAYMAGYGLAACGGGV